MASRPQPATPANDPAMTLLELLWRLDHGLQRVSKRMLGVLGVTGPQRVVIRTIGRFSGLTPGDLARRVHDHPSTLTGVLKRLERDGLVVRAGDPADQRRFHLYLTQAGLKIDAVREGTAESAVRAALARLPEAEVTAFQRVLVAIAEELERTAEAGLRKAE
ncbi:MAG: MarR family winged helix-turn-helix transcriptional regulator [Myxococcota bacterium]